MQLLLASAKTMTGTAPARLPETTEPPFLAQANAQARALQRYTVEELQGMLGVNPEIALTTWKRYQHFFDNDGLVPAVFAYNGTVYQKLDADTFSADDLLYANSHLVIGTSLYGLLRPLDMVHRYRMDGHVVLPQNGVKMFNYWQPIVTDWFISKIKADDGILVNIAAAEFQDLFDWKRVLKEVRVISPQFKVDKGGRLATVVVYAKMCRGAMARWILKNRITDVESLKAFEYEGFALDPSAGEWTFVNR